MAGRECDAITDYERLSAVELGHWPILLTACRLHRLPVPAQLWLDIVDALEPDERSDAAEDADEPQGQPGRRPIPRARRSEEHTPELQAIMRLPYAVF